MELYFKDFISEEASLEKLVDDLSLLVQGANDFAEAAGVNLPPESRAEIVGRLNRLKESCRRIREQTVAGVRATDRMLRRHPYSFVGAAFAVGCLIGVKLRGKP